MMVQLLSGYLSISEIGCKDLGKCLPSVLSPREKKILVESFETKKGKEVFFKTSERPKGIIKI